MTEREITRILRQKCPSQQPGAVRRSKLKMRYGKDWNTLSAEIRRTREKLDILVELKTDWEQRLIAGAEQ